MIFEYADQQRGYEATGGEIFIPVIPLLIWLVIRVTRDLLKTITKEWRK